MAPVFFCKTWKKTKKKQTWIWKDLRNIASVLRIKSTWINILQLTFASVREHASTGELLYISLCATFPDYAISADQTASLWQWTAKNCLSCNRYVKKTKTKKNLPSLNIDDLIRLFLFKDSMIIWPMRLSNKPRQMHTNWRDAEGDKYLKT